MATTLLAISDIHIGCPRLNPQLLHERLRKFFYPHIEGSDILFICGDFFDSLLNMNSLASLETIEIIKEIRYLCKKNNCDLRVLRGTFTHDRNQPQHFVNGVDPNDPSVKLYDTVAFELNEKTGLRIVYIPDNVASEDIYRDIRELLDKHGIERADVMIHHGYFNHLLPPCLPPPHGSLDADRIKDYVSGCVLNGHVHIPVIYKNVISVGSFDRLSHGEEHPKGCYKITISDSKIYQFKFIENKDANKFLSIDLRSFGHDVESASSWFAKKWADDAKSFDEGESVRLRLVSDDQGIVDSCTEVAKSITPNILIDKPIVAKREQILENVAMNTDVLPQITPSNLEDLLMPILEKYNTNVDRQVVHNILTSCTNTKEV